MNDELVAKIRTVIARLDRRTRNEAGNILKAAQISYVDEYREYTASHDPSDPFYEARPIRQVKLLARLLRLFREAVSQPDQVEEVEEKQSDQIEEKRRVA